MAHALLDMLPPEKLNAVRSLLEVMVETIVALAGHGSRRRRGDHCRNERGSGPRAGFARPWRRRPAR
jgi:hypothetical protein